MDFIPAAMALALIAVALITYWVGSQNSDRARGSLINSIDRMADRIVRLEEEDRKKWEKITELERRLVRRETVLRTIYRGSLALMAQLAEAGLAPVWTPPDSVKRYYDGDHLGIDTRTTDLVTMIDRHFNAEEIETMALDLGLDYDNLKGATKRAKIASIVTHFERRGFVDSLIDYCIENRPGVYGWPII